MIGALAYYNEIDPFAAQWLRELIKAGHIAPGHVDERSIEDVRPEELNGYTQCHFFAGIGVWSYALRKAGWPDDRPIWTGSCPCQPFSASGKRAGFIDERHLWPDFYWLIEQCHPPVVLGEQVASKYAEPWFDLVQADLEALDYAFGCVPFPSAGVGAPHIRDRAYWVAYNGGAGLQERVSYRRVQRETMVASERQAPVSSGDVGRLADDTGNGRREECQDGSRSVEGDRAQRQPPGFEPSGSNSGMADAELQQRPKTSACRNEAGRRQQETAAAAGLCSNSGAGPTNGFWRASDWLHCRDGKWRPVEPGTFPLAHGAPARVGRLRGYGNAINAEAAKVFIECVQEITNEQH